MALVIAEMKVQKITMADMITTTLKRRSISLRGVTWNEDFWIHCLSTLSTVGGKMDSDLNGSKGLFTHRSKIAISGSNTLSKRKT